MTSITIIIIVVIALLTAVIAGLTWLAYSSCIKAYKIEINSGKHDEEILKEYHSKKKNKSGLVGIICSYLALTTLAGLFIVGVVYKARGENLSINNQTALVIKTGSMSDYYNSKLADEHPEYKILQFDVGDICIFESNFDELKEGEVYGYKYKDIIVTHRLIKDHGTWYEFKGDNNLDPDRYYVTSDEIIYHYTGQKIPGIGAFILYAQSYFGIWSIIGIIGIAVCSEIVYHKIEKINKERDKLIYIPDKKSEEKIEEKPTEEEIIKEPTAEAPSKTHEEKEGAEDEK